MLITFPENLFQPFGDLPVSNQVCNADRLLIHGGKFPRLGTQEHSRLVGRVCSKREPLSAREHSFYTDHLLYHSTTQQRAVAAMPGELKKNPTLNPRIMRSWAERAVRRDPSLAEMIEDVRVAERLLAPCVRLFSFLLGENGRALADVANDVRATWPAGARKLDLDRLHELRTRIQTATGFRPHSDQQWLVAAQSLSDGDHESLIRALCEINASVMQQRGGSRWISIEHGKLRVHAFEAARGLSGRSSPIS